MLPPSQPLALVPVPPLKDSLLCPPKIFMEKAHIFTPRKAEIGLGHFNWSLKSRSKPETDSGIIIPVFQSTSAQVPMMPLKFFITPPRERRDKRISVLSQLAVGVILFDSWAFQQNKRPFQFFYNICSL